MSLHKILRVATALAGVAAWALPAAAQARRPARARTPVTRPAAPSTRSALANRLNLLLDEPPFDRGLWGIVIADPTGRVVFERNGGRLFVPASTAKLVVAATAAALLPEDFRITTSVYPGGTLADSVLRGDLILYGRGDPTLNARDRDGRAAGFEDLAGQLYARGVRVVAGDLVGDASWFDSLTTHPSWEHGDLLWSFAAPVTALGYNGNAVDVAVTPGAPGLPPIITFAPDIGLARLTNRARTVPADSPRTFDYVRTPGSNEFLATGDVPVDTRPWTDNLAVADGPRWAVTAFRQALRDRGITVAGRSRTTFDPAAFAAARQAPALAEHRSPPLDDLMRPILAVSDNWYAELLLRTLGVAFRGQGSFAAGLDVERRFLIDALGVDSTQFNLVDGSGLSHHDLVAPRVFVTLLRAVRQHPRGGRFLDALAEPGRAGTLRSRFRATAPRGRVRAKTGSIASTNALAGYLDTGDGRYWTFAVQLNNHLASSREVLRRIDAVVAAIGR